MQTSFLSYYYKEEVGRYYFNRLVKLLHSYREVNYITSNIFLGGGLGVGEGETYYNGKVYSIFYTRSFFIRIKFSSKGRSVYHVRSLTVQGLKGKGTFPSVTLARGGCGPAWLCLERVL